MSNRFRFIALTIILTMLPQSVFAGGNAIKVYNPTESVKRRWGTAATVATIGGVATGATVGTVGILANAGVITAGAVTLGAVGAASLGIGIAAMAAAGIIAFASYKLYQKYKTKHMAIPSEEVEELHKLAAQQRKPVESLIRRHLETIYDPICADVHGEGYRYDHEKSKRQERKTNLFSSIRGKYLTAYSNEGEKEHYNYVKGYPSILMEKLVCSKKPVRGEGRLDYLRQEIEDDIYRDHHEGITTRRDKPEFRGRPRTWQEYLAQKSSRAE